MKKLFVSVIIQVSKNVAILLSIYLLNQKSFIIFQISSQVDEEEISTIFILPNQSFDK